MKRGLPQEDNNTPRRRFFAKNFQVGGTVVLDAQESWHLVRVLRLGVGAKITVFDGRGRTAAAVVQKAAPREVVVAVVRELPGAGESPLALTLGIGLAKGAAIDAVICQATEMGVKQICPFISSRSERLSPHRAVRRVERWRRLALETLKICRRSYMPEITAVQDFAAILAGPEEEKIIFWEEAEPHSLRELLAEKKTFRSARILIGPEGGFTPAEVQQAQEHGFRVASLGPRCLRVETAALAAMAILQFAWGDLA